VHPYLHTCAQRFCGPEKSCHRQKESEDIEGKLHIQDITTGQALLALDRLVSRRGLTKIILIQKHGAAHRYIQLICSNRKKEHEQIGRSDTNTFQGLRSLSKPWSGYFHTKKWWHVTQRSWHWVIWPMTHMTNQSIDPWPRDPSPMTHNYRPKERLFTTVTTIVFSSLQFAYGLYVLHSVCMRYTYTHFTHHPL